MVDLALLQSVSYIAGALGVCVAAVYYMMNIRISQRNQELTLKALEQSARAQELTLKSQEQNLETRQAQLFMGIYDRSQEVEFLKNWNQVMGRDLKEAEALWDMESVWSDYSWTSIAKYFEGIGVLVKRGLVSADLVYDYMPTLVTSFWERYAPLVGRIREAKSWPQAALMIEYLAVEMEKVARERGNPIGIKY
jgi:hypothetical protein